MKSTLKITRDGTELRERLQKVLAQSGLGSRRGLEERILRGDILINGEPAEIGLSLASGDRILIDGKAYVARRVEGDYGRIIIYNKPDGEITTRHDPEGRRTVFERLPRIKGQRWISIGRLDVNTQGLLVFTTNGALADYFTHPSREIEREYMCRVFGDVTEEQLTALRKGVELEDGPAAFSDLTPLSDEENDSSNHWFRAVLKEGRHREVRRLWSAVGLDVSRLKRTRYGPFVLNQALKRGEMMELDRADVDALCVGAGLGPPPPILLAVDPRLRRWRDAEDQPEGEGDGESGMRRPRRYEISGEALRDGAQNRHIERESVLGEFGERARPEEAGRGRRGRPGQGQGPGRKGPGRPGGGAGRGPGGERRGGRPSPTAADGAAPPRRGRGPARPGEPRAGGPAAPGPDGAPRRGRGPGRPGRGAAPAGTPGQPRPDRSGGRGPGPSGPRPSGRGPGRPNRGPAAAPTQPRFSDDGMPNFAMDQQPRFPSEVQARISAGHLGGYTDPQRPAGRGRGPKGRGGAQAPRGGPQGGGSQGGPSKPPAGLAGMHDDDEG